MDNNPDSIEKLMAELQALGHRFIALGAASERARVHAAIFPGTPELAGQPGYEVRLKHYGDGNSPPVKKYPYGFVADNVREALKAHPKGMTADQVVAFVTAKAEIDEDSIRQTLKSFKKRGAVLKTGLAYVPTPSL